MLKVWLTCLELLKKVDVKRKAKSKQTWMEKSLNNDEKNDEPDNK